MHWLWSRGKGQVSGAGRPGFEAHTTQAPVLSYSGLVSLSSVNQRITNSTAQSLTTKQEHGVFIERYQVSGPSFPFLFEAPLLRLRVGFY